MGFHFVIFAILLVSVNQCWSQFSNHQLSLHSSFNCGGRPLFLNQFNEPNLLSRGFDNFSYSVTVRGIWLFYENPNYNENEGKMEFIFSPNTACINLGHVAGKLSSVRFAGWVSDYKANSLTLYKGTYFQGQEEYTHQEGLGNLALDKQVSSFIITGAMPWTLYALPNYQGQAKCVYPPASNNFKPGFIHDTSSVGIPKNAIRSIRRGCFASDTVTAQAFPDAVPAG